MTDSPHTLTELDEEKKTGRTEAFSDGVIAIAITLLAFDLAVPSPEQSASMGGLINALLDEYPRYVGFISSFLTILIMWINHHRMLQMVVRFDFPFLLYNGLLLMGISVVPFTSKLVSTYLRTDEGNIAVAIYATVFTLIAAMFNLVWRRVSTGKRLLNRSIDQTLIDSINAQYRFGPFLYLFGVLAALVWAPAGLIVIIGLAISFALPGLRRGQRT